MSRSDNLAFASVVIALVACVGSFFVPEVRRLVGVDTPAVASIADSGTGFKATPKRSTPKITTTTVPNLKGTGLSRAKTLLESSNLTASPSANWTDGTQPRGTVVGQYPLAGAVVKEGLAVKLILSNGPKKAVDKAVEGWQVTIALTLIDLLEDTRVRIAMTDAKGKRTIYEADHKPGDKFMAPLQIAYGKEAKFEIYYGDELVKTAVEPLR